MAEKMTCTQCGMPCDAGEYHPYAACLMFTACHNSETVRANLAQPSQAVDVEAIPDAKPLPDLMLASYHEAVGWNAYREALLTRAIGNAQAEGWSVSSEFIEDIQRAERLAVKSKKLNRERMMGLAVLKHLGHLLPIPPTQATTNAHE